MALALAITEPSPNFVAIRPVDIVGPKIGPAITAPIILPATGTPIFIKS